MECMICKKPARELRVKTTTGSKVHLMKSFCMDCIFNLGKILGVTKEPSLVCSQCKQVVHVLKSGECKDCYSEARVLVKLLPNDLEYIEPPLGYEAFIGCSEESAKAEVNYFYNRTPRKGELPC